MKNTHNHNGTLQHPLPSGFTATSTVHDVINGIDLTNKTAIVTGGYKRRNDRYLIPGKLNPGMINLPYKPKRFGLILFCTFSTYKWNSKPK